MSTIEVRLPEPLAKRLQEEAVPANEAIVEALEAWLEQREQERVKKARKLERVRLLEAIKGTGLLEPMGERWEHLISKAPRLSHQELQERMKGKPSLSELIINERDQGRQ